MSLHKKLWLAVILLMSLAFGGSFIVSTLSAKTYLEKQLRLKNIDNVNSLALSLSHDSADPIILELKVAAQFDTGHYQFIKLTSPSGKVIVDKTSNNTTDNAPHWFTQLFPIESKPAIAQISDGWRQTATLTLQSHSKFAYKEMWRSTQLLFLYFLAGALFSGLIGNRILKTILKPLGDAVAQAEAIGQRRFITIDVPNTQEFRIVAKSMNTLSNRVKTLLHEEASRLEEFRKDIQIDKVTDLLTREPFLSRLESTLKNDDTDSSGTLVILRTQHLAELNRSEGRVVMDTMLKRFGDILKRMAQRYEHAFAGRLNGSDFALLISGHEHPHQLATEINQVFTWITKDMQLEEKVILPTATGQYHANDSLQTLLSRIDTSLAQAELDGNSAIRLAENTNQSAPNTINEWRDKLEQALTNRSFKLTTFPVSNNKGDTLHLEAPARLIQKDNELTAGQFLPWLSRLGWTSRLDSLVLELAVEYLAVNDQNIGINLSSQILSDEQTMKPFIDKIKKHPEAAKHLWLEIPEYGAYQHLDNFKYFCQQLKPLSCHIGIEHVGPGVLDIGKLHDVGIDYVKIDSAIIRNINNNISNQIFLRGLCSIVHSIGLTAIAEGIETQEEWDTTQKMGMDAGTGPFFH